MRDAECLHLPWWHELSFEVWDITREEVISSVKLLHSCKATGIYVILVSVIQNNINTLAFTLTSIFNKAFFTGVYPDALNMARVVPIH